MMTIKDLRDILIHFTDRKYDDYEVTLWDYNHQQDCDWGGGYSLSHPDKRLVFPITVNDVNEETITDRIKKVMDDLKNK